MKNKTIVLARVWMLNMFCHFIYFNLTDQRLNFQAILFRFAGVIFDSDFSIPIEISVRVPDVDQNIRDVKLPPFHMSNWRLFR